MGFSSIEQKKEKGTPVYPVKILKFELFQRLLEYGMGKNKKDPEREAHKLQVLGLEDTDPEWMRAAAVFRLVGTAIPPGPLSDDLFSGNLIPLWDKLQNTESVFRDGFVYSLPADNHNGVGFVAMRSGDAVQVFQDGAWVGGTIAVDFRRDGVVGVFSDGGDMLEITDWYTILRK